VLYVLAVFALRLCTHAELFLLSWGRVQGVSWGLFLSKLVIFVFQYSPTLHIRDFHVRYYRTPFFYSERTVSVCIMTLYSVFVLSVFSTSFFFLFLLHTSCVFFLCIQVCTLMCYILPSPSARRALSLVVHIYLEGPIYLEGSICFEGS
jgi:hypothetical protein